MKKKSFFVLGMLSIMLAICLTFVGCDNGNGSGPNTDPKSIKITGITGIGTDTNGEGDIRLLTSTDATTPTTLVARAWGNSIWHNPVANNQVLSGEFRITEEWDHTDKPWTGIGEYYIKLELAPIGGFGTASSRNYWWAKNGEIVKYNIQDTLTTLDFSEFKQ